MIKTILTSDKDASLSVCSKFLHGTFGVIYVPNAMYVVPYDAYTNFHEVREAKGKLTISAKGTKISSFANGDTVYFQPFEGKYMLFYKKVYDKNLPCPVLSTEMLRPIYIVREDVSADKNKAETTSSVYCNEVHVTPEFKKKYFENEEDFDITYRFPSNGKTWIEVTKAAKESVPTFSEYINVYGRNIPTIVKDGLTLRIHLEGLRKRTLRFPIPVHIAKKMGIKSGFNLSMPTWYDKKNERAIFEAPIVNCVIDDKPARSTEDVPPVPVTLCPTCASEAGEGGTLEKLTTMFSDVFELMLAQNEKLDRLIAAQGEMEQTVTSVRAFKSKLVDMTKTLSELDF